MEGIADPFLFHYIVSLEVNMISSVGIHVGRPKPLPSLASPTYPLVLRHFRSSLWATLQTSRVVRYGRPEKTTLMPVRSIRKPRRGALW
jgi:hypothetical protein